MWIRDNRGGVREGELEYFRSHVWMEELASLDDSDQLTMLEVHFAPGARTAWHRHPRGQILRLTQVVGQS